jgi:Xaa-Pro dipeptidase
MLCDEKRLSELLQSSGVDVAVFTSPESVYYLSQYSSPLYPFTGTTAAVVFSSKGKALVINICEGFAPYNQGADMTNLKFYDEFYFAFATKLRDVEKTFKAAYEDYYKNGIRDDISRLAESIKEMGAQEGRIGVERWMPMAMKDALQEVLPRAVFKDITQIIEESRIIKTEEEVVRIRDAARINARALRAVIETVHSGVSEWDLVRAFRAELDNHKAEPIFQLINSGKGSGELFPTYRRPRRLRKGDVIRVDIGCRYMGYCSDLSRTVVLGKLSQEDQNIRKAIQSGCWSTIQMLRPGLKVKDVFRQCVDDIRKTIPGFNRSNVGHGIGLSVHEAPSMNSSSDRKLETDMVLNIETPLYGIGIGGFQQEDTVRITDSGIDLLTKFPRVWDV